MIISLFEQHSPSISQLSQTQKKIPQKIKGSYQTRTVIADILGFTSFFLPATDLILCCILCSLCYCTTFSPLPFCSNEWISDVPFHQSVPLAFLFRWTGPLSQSGSSQTVTRIYQTGTDSVIKRNRWHEMTRILKARKTLRHIAALSWKPSCSRSFVNDHI